MNNTKKRKKLVVLSGAGISAESGIRTFRDMGGLWEEYDVMEVASIDGWHKNPELVIDFYNQRRSQLADCEPNAGHTILAELEEFFDVHILTQNVDDLHERAGSSNILHIHGELTKVRSTGDEQYILDIGYRTIRYGDVCAKGFQLRPHIVWFGEPVPAMNKAIQIAQTADLFVVVGTSLNVYPAAGLVQYAPAHCPVYVIDPNTVEVQRENLTLIQEPASKGMESLKTLLLEK